MIMVLKEALCYRVGTRLKTVHRTHHSILLHIFKRQCSVHLLIYHNLLNASGHLFELSLEKEASWHFILEFKDLSSRTGVVFAILGILFLGTAQPKLKS